MGAFWVPPQVFYCIPSSNGWPNRGCQQSLGAFSPNSLWAHQTMGQLLTHSPVQRQQGNTFFYRPIRYGLYTILDKIGENAYRLDLPPQLGIHNIINVNHLNLFDASLLEEPVNITHPVDNIPNFQLPLAKDTILDTQSLSTRHKTYTSYMVTRQDQTRSQAKQITIDVFHNKFPHLLMEARILLDINMEELGQGGHLGERPTRAHESITQAQHFFTFS